jgi:hypothetical protein
MSKKDKNKKAGIFDISSFIPNPSTKFVEEDEDKDDGAQTKLKEHITKLMEIEGAVMATRNEWAVNGSSFFASTRADKVKCLPAGVYEFKASLTGWWLDRTGDEFEFPFKVYNASQHIIDRVCKYWDTHGGNLGVLMNGLRGAGKTMTAQLLANKLIREKNLPVLVVRSPVPLQLIFNAVQQDMLVIFDEFEKTHSIENGEQQQLLSTIDGMSRSSHSRLIIFTTNSERINENFKDRPSRIHYKFQFDKVADEVIDGLINDSLDADLMQYKLDILAFLSTRDICTIDIVKAVIAEVQAFRESPLQFENILNIAKGQPPAFTVNVIDPDNGEVMKTVDRYFKLAENGQYYTSLLLGNAQSILEMKKGGQTFYISSHSWAGRTSIKLLEKAEEDGCWLGEVGLPFSKTPWAAFECLRNDDGNVFWQDAQPAKWKLPSPKSVAGDEKAENNIREMFDSAKAAGTVHGGKKVILKLHIEANHSTYIPARYQVTDPQGKVAFYGDD